MSKDPESSLELLLDTITNTFGGIVFLALLVVVLLQLTSDRMSTAPPKPETADRLITLEKDMIIATAKRDVLLRTLAIQAQLLDQLSTESSRQDLARLQQARARVHELESVGLDLAQSVVGNQNEINGLAARMDDLNRRLRIRKADIENADRELQAEIRSRTTTARLPLMHETAKAEVAIVIRYGRAYFVHRYDAQLSSREVNTDDMVVIEDADEDVVATPKPYAGIPIADSDTLRKEMQMALERYPPGLVYLAIAVWEDSFNHFIRFKNVLVEMGYEYRVIPVEVGGIVSESSGPTPRVQ